MFIPKRIYVKPQSRSSVKAKEVIERAQKLDPNIEVINLSKKEFEYPSVLTPKERFFFMKESVILSERAEPFIKTFASPGDIVESLNTTLNYSWMCPSNCEYCYLQTNQTPEHYIYTNLKDLENEFISAPYAHWAILTIWSMISYARKQSLFKIPDGLMEYADRLREEFSKGIINNTRRAIDWLYLRQNKIYKDLKGKQSIKQFGLTEKEFKFSREMIEQYYINNSLHRLRMIPSEFCDLVAVDHLTKNIAHLARLVAKTPDVEIDIRTKSNQIEDIRSFSGSDRITFAISLNTDYVISKYEHGTATLDERLNAARTVQESEGYKLDIVIEPFIKYNRCMKDYIALIGKVAKAIDFNKVRKISLGSVRYRKQLMARINRNFPATDLFAPTQDLKEPEKDDYRLRYSIDFLTKTYKQLRKEIAKYSIAPFSLAAEKPGLWNKLGLNPEEHLEKSVYQYSELDMSKKSQKSDKTEKEENTFNQTPSNVNGESGEADVRISVGYCVEMEILNAKQEIDIQHFYDAGERLDKLEYSEYVTKENGSIAKLSFDIWDSIDSVTIRTARRAENLWYPVKIIGRIKGITSASPLEIGNKDHSYIIPVRAITFEDKENSAITTFSYPEKLFPDNIDSFIKSKKPLIFMGCIVPIHNDKNNKSEYRFYIRNILVEPSMSDLVAIPKSQELSPGFSIKLKSGKTIGIPKNDPYLIIDKYGYSHKNKRDGKELFGYIKDTLISNLNILGSEYEASHLETGIEFVILQSLSQGNKNSFSNKLHGLIIGPPNVGKSLLSEGAIVLNPIAERLSPVSAKITAAGLVGKVRDVEGKSVSSGGKLPSLAGGTLCIEEFHQIKQKRETVLNIFSNLMEKGIVQDDTSANATLEAEVSLLIDTNRYSQVNKNKDIKTNTYSDLDIPIHILSRFDFILDIPNNPQRQNKVSERIILETASSTSQSWKFELKNLIAFLRDQYVGIIISDEILSYAKNKLISLFDEFKSDNFETNIQDHQPRIARSLNKYVEAIARAWARPVVTEEHIDFALKFIRQKLIFLSNQKFNEIKLDGRSKKKEERAQLVIDYFKNSYLTRPKLEEFFKKQYGSVEGINISREIKTLLDGKLIQPVKRAVWKVISSKDSAKPQVPIAAKKLIQRTKKRKSTGKKPIKKRKK